MSYRTYTNTLLAILLLSIATFLTHIIYCIQTQQWGILIAGAIAPPIGIIHGIMVWMSFIRSLL